MSLFGVPGGIRVPRGVPEGFGVPELSFCCPPFVFLVSFSIYFGLFEEH